uniref:Uncharacterized protein n=1 Tax=Parascaris univalens TaxID=6257 RepID=A0A915BFU8_PARUN
DMSNFPIYRARSSICLPRSRSVERYGDVATLTRVCSVPNLDSYYVSDAHGSSTLHKYRRDWDIVGVLKTLFSSARVKGWPHLLHTFRL